MSSVGDPPGRFASDGGVLHATAAYENAVAFYLVTLASLAKAIGLPLGQIVGKK